MRIAEEKERTEESPSEADDESFDELAQAPVGWQDLAQRKKVVGMMRWRGRRVVH